MDWSEVISIVLRWLIPFICCGFITWIGGYHGKNKAMREGLRSLLRSEIIRAYEKYTERGYCPIYAREPLTKVYEAYHAMGGNGTGTKFYNDTMDLPSSLPRGEN